MLEFLVRIILKIFSWLPLGFGRLIGVGIGYANMLFNSRVAQTTAENIDLCFADLSAAERKALYRQSLINTGKTLMETPAIWLGKLSKLEAKILEVENVELFSRSREENQGLLILLPHLGNWEVLNVYLADKDINMTALYKEPSQPWMRNIMAEVRSHFGSNMVPTTKRGIAQLFRVLKGGDVVVVLPDQVPAAGEFAPFFGEPALTDRLVSKLVAKCAPKVICCTVPRVPGGFKVRFSEVDDTVYSQDLLSSICGVNASVEASVRADPGQYQWDYKRFKVRPEGLPQLYG